MSMKPGLGARQNSFRPSTPSPAGPAGWPRASVPTAVPRTKAATSGPPAKRMSPRESDVPRNAHERPCPVAEFARHAAQHKGCQHKAERQVEGRRQQRVDSREGGEQRCAPDHHVGVVESDKVRRASHFG